MNLLIHLSMAILMKKMIQREFPVRMNSAAFLFGSIKPDLLPRKKAPHKMHQSKGFVEDEIKALMEQTDIKGRFTWDFSERIGVIMHYLSDFFCYAHSPGYEGSFREHVRYEHTHAEYFHTGMKAALKSRKFGCSTYLNPEEMMQYLEQQHLEYSGGSPSAAEDMKYALKVGSTICLSMIAFIMESCDFCHETNQKAMLCKEA